MKKYSAALLLLLCALVGLPGRASAQINIVSGPKDTTSHGYFVIKFRIAFDPVNRVYLQAWDDPAVGHIQGQFLDVQGNRIGGPFALGGPQTGWVNVTFGGPANKPRFLVTYLVGNGSTNPKFARLVEYSNGLPGFGPELYITDVNGEWSDADIAGAVWTGSQFVVSWRYQGASFLRGIDIDGNYTVGPQSLGDGLDVEVNPTLACGGGMCLAHGFAFGIAFGAVGGSWARLFDPQSLAPVGPVFYVDNHAGIMEDQRVAYNERTGQFQLVWVRLKSQVDFRLVAPNGQVGPLDFSKSIPGGQIALTYNAGTQTSLLTMNGADIRVTAVELNDSGYPMRDGNGNLQPLPVSLSWQGEGSPPLYYSMPAANPIDAQWLVVYSAFTNGRATLTQGVVGQALTYSVSPTAWNVGSNGGTQVVTITDGNGSAPPWTTQSNDSSWLTVSPGNGAGGGGVTLTAAANPFPTGRSATVSVAGRQVLVNQTGKSLPALSGGVGLLAGPKDTTSHGYFVIKFRVAFDPVNKVYLQAWDDPAHGYIEGQFLDTQGNRIGGPFALGGPQTGWVNVTFGGPANKPRFLVTYLLGNGSTNPKFARLVEYSNGLPVFGPELYITNVNGEWSDADIAGAVWTGSQFVLSWRQEGASYLRGIDIDGNYTVGPQSLGDGLDVEVNPLLACGGGVCLAHGFAFGIAFGAVGGSWARFFDPQSLAPIGPVFYVDNHAGIMEDQRIAYNGRTGQFQIAWVRQKSQVDFRLVAPSGQVGPLDLSRSLPGGQIALTYNPGTQTSLLTMNGPGIRVTAVELNDSGYPMRDGNGNLQLLPVSLSWQGEGSPPLYYSMPAANPADAQWLVVYSAFTNGRAAIIQGAPAAGTISRPAGPPVMRLDGDTFSDVFAYRPADGSWGRSLTQVGGGFATAGGNWLQGWAMLAAEFDGDGLTDIFLFHPTTGQWYKLLNTGSGFAVQIGGAWSPAWQKFVIDLNGDGISDLFLYDPATGVWYKAISTPTGFGYYQSQWDPGYEITPMNLNGDAFGDLFLFNRSTGRWFWVLGQDGGGFSYPQTGFWGAEWTFYPGDFNGDGLTDLLLLDQATGRLYVVHNRGGAGFDYTASAWLPGWTPYVADLNGDGADDVFLYNTTGGMWYELISNRQGQFSAEGGGFWTPGWEIHPMDFNGDKRTDLLLYNPVTGVWYQAWNFVTGAFGYANGTWAPGLTILTGSPRR